MNVKLERIDCHTKKPIRSEIEEEVFLHCVHARVRELERLQREEGKMFPASDKKELKFLQSFTGWLLL